MTVDKLVQEFCWLDTEEIDDTNAGAEQYQQLVAWAGRARGKNPLAFDALTGWLLDDAQWSEDRLAENQRILMQGVLARFQQQNALLRERLLWLKPTGVVNEALFPALDRFDSELKGKTQDGLLQNAVGQLFANFSVMSDSGVRKQIAGDKTGPAGTDHADVYGYINCLKDCDAAVQWALFMPETVANQQKGFRVSSFSYQKMPAMRFIGREGGDLGDAQARRELFCRLDALHGYRSGFDYDILLLHHNGLCVDVGPCHAVWGRFMKPDTPVPEGFLSLEFVPYDDGKEGPPYLSQFAFAVFSGDSAAMHSCEGYDSDAMYDVTRNIMLGQGVPIPYPHKYWAAEVYIDGWHQPSTGYLFSAQRQTD